MNLRILMPVALVAILLVPPLLAEDDVAAQVKQISDAYAKDYQKLVSDYQAEKDAKKKQEIVAKQLPTLSKTYTDKFQKLADMHAKTPAAVDPLAMVCQLAGRSPEGQAIVAKAKATLLADHINDAAFAQAVSMWSRDDAKLAMFAKESKSRDVQGLALYFQMSKAKGRELSEKNVAIVKPMMERITSEFGDVKMVYPGGMVRGTLADLVDNELFAFENLRIGKVAPEVVGDDLDGVEFKLSDYRGKVVVIDFWGDW
jgi:hypothetical protein